MNEYYHLIKQHETEVNRLHAEVREAFGRSDQSKHARRDWELAAKRFREHKSEVDDLVERCMTQDIGNDRELRAFTFSYVKSDPYFFRSGYILERLVRRIKKLDLSETEKVLIQELILKRIDTNALRNFRDICRLIPMIETEGFSNKIAARLRSDEPSIRHRAEFAALYFPIRGKARGVGFEMA